MNIPAVSDPPARNRGIFPPQACWLSFALDMRTEVHLLEEVTVWQDLVAKMLLSSWFITYIQAAVTQSLRRTIFILLLHNCRVSWPSSGSRHVIPLGSPLVSSPHASLLSFARITPPRILNSHCISANFGLITLEQTHPRCANNWSE